MNCLYKQRMAQRDWFDPLINPLSEDEEDARTEERPTFSSHGASMPPLMIDFLQKLKNYTYSFLDRVYLQAQSFASKQDALGIPASRQKTIGELYRMSLDFYKTCIRDEFEKEIAVISKDYGDMRTNWDSVFNLFLLSYYHGDQSALSAMLVKKKPGYEEVDGGSQLFPSMIVRRPGYVHVVKTALIDFLQPYLVFLVSCPVVRNERTLAEWNYVVLGDAIQGSMFHAMIKLANEKSECNFNMSMFEISLRNEGDRARAIRVEEERLMKSMQSQAVDPRGRIEQGNFAANMLDSSQHGREMQQHRQEGSRHGRETSQYRPSARASQGRLSTTRGTPTRDVTEHLQHGSLRQGSLHQGSLHQGSLHQGSLRQNQSIRVQEPPPGYFDNVEAPALSQPNLVIDLGSRSVRSSYTPGSKARQN